MNTQEGQLATLRTRLDALVAALEKIRDKAQYLRDCAVDGGRNADAETLGNILNIATAALEVKQ